MKSVSPEEIDSHLVRLLKDEARHYLSGEDIAREIGISRTAVWKRMRCLQEAGYEIEAVPHRGYRLTCSPDLVLPEEVRYRLKTKVFGNKISAFSSVDSTNRVALEWGQRGVGEGAVIIAEKQTAGKGRLGRRWESPQGKGLYFSLLLRPPISVRDIPRLTLTAASAVAEVLKEEFGIEARIRWPNDVMIKRKKICGILTEINAEADVIRYAVLGMGLNANGVGTGLPRTAITIESIIGNPVDRAELLSAILARLEMKYEAIKNRQWVKLQTTWNALSAIRGRQISVKTLNEKIEGEAESIEEDGALTVRINKDVFKRLYSGDVELLR